MTLTVQFYTIVSMMLMGVFVGAAVDTYGRFMHPSRWSIALFFSDILFWIVQGLLIFFVLLKVNEGEIRFYVFLALICGFAMYRALFQRLFNHVLNILIRFFNAFIRGAVKVVNTIILNPVKFTFRLLFRILIFFGGGFVAFGLFITRLLGSIMKWFGRFIWHFTPDFVKKQLEKVAGIPKVVQNKIKKWIDRF